MRPRTDPTCHAENPKNSRRSVRSSRRPRTAAAKSISRRSSVTWHAWLTRTTRSSRSSLLPKASPRRGPSPFGPGTTSLTMSSGRLRGRPVKRWCKGPSATTPQGCGRCFQTTGHWSSGESKVIWACRCAIPRGGFSATSRSSTSARCRGSREGCLRSASSRRAPPPSWRVHLEQQLRESEERLRDLYEEAPIAYVKEDMESRFISANHAALRILGIKPEEVPGFVGKSLVPDTPEAQRRVKVALASIGRG